MANINYLVMNIFKRFVIPAALIGIVGFLATYIIYKCQDKYINTHLYVPGPDSSKYLEFIGVPVFDS